ncbi:hypothetical protein [Sphaerimonospora thailandensis]|uniref:Mce-associated membrane protein n=1 Tax=Sphaerimonospora thailandensis TaxID=795644 RepID=A0A8J3VZ31_9ACTN|nr:hypothetical protein [Sphaerimonospora thailandensis]GIH69618.1 hypothetical protein Mth01_18710 [Sphaerimonospora thailandensis]
MSRRRGRSRVLPALLALVAVGLAAAALWIFLDLRRLQESAASAASARTAARLYAAEMLSYDYRTIDRDLARASGRATGSLVAHFRELAGTLGPQARQRKTVQQAVVAAVGVESATPDEVHVLVFVNMVTTSTPPGQESPRQEISQGRVRLVLVTQGDDWRVARLSTLLGDAPVR